MAVQHAIIRDTLDQPYRAAKAALKVAYADWKRGVSHPFRGHDKGATVADSTELFEALYALIGFKYQVALVAANAALPVRDRIATEEINPTVRVVDETLLSAADQARIATWAGKREIDAGGRGNTSRSTDMATYAAEWVTRMAGVGLSLTI